MTTPAPVLPRLTVDAPSPPQPHKYGLFSAATVLENAEPHALTGIEYETVCSTRVDPYPAPCRPGETFDRRKQPSATTAVVDATPFGVVAADECVMGRDPQRAKQQLRQRFQAGEETAVERIVRTGELGNTPALETEAQVVPGDTAPDIPDAIGLLEQWLADTTGGVGVLHAPLMAAPGLLNSGAATASGPRAVTKLGSAWAFGAGYTGGPPQGVADDGALWLYATGTVTVRRSAIVEPADWGTGAYSRDENVGLLVAERVYVVDWPCGVATVKTARTRPGWVAPTV